MLYIIGFITLVGALVVVCSSSKYRWLLSSYVFSYMSYASSCGDKDRHKDKLDDEEQGFSPHFDPFVSTHRQQELYRAHENNSELRWRQHGNGDAYGYGMMDTNAANNNTININ